MTQKNLIDKLKSNGELKKDIEEYFCEFKNALEQSPDTIPRDNKFGWSMGAAGWITHTKETSDLARKISQRAEKLLGNKFADVEEISKLIQNKAHECLRDEKSKREYHSMIIQSIEEILENEFEIYIPNYLVILPKGKDSVSIGPVRIIKLEKVIKEVNDLKDRLHDGYNRINIFMDTEKGLSYSLGGNDSYLLPSNHAMWAVKVKASKVNLAEEALWLIGVATSLLRMLGKKWDYPIPSLAELEPSPHIINKDFGKSFLHSTKTSIPFGGSRIILCYNITSKVFNELNKSKNQDIIKSIFEHKEKTVGEQVYSALGWLSMGRQSNDRSTSLLFFITAIEAILSRDGNASPVVDTIARHGSVALSRTIEGRYEVSKIFKEIYGSRSKIVHKGYRLATKTAAANAQYFAEILVKVVIDKCNLSQTHDSFCNELSHATFGTEWTPSTNLCPA